jgi:hypothetical protein
MLSLQPRLRARSAELVIFFIQVVKVSPGAAAAADGALVKELYPLPPLLLLLLLLLEVVVVRYHLQDLWRPPATAVAPQFICRVWLLLRGCSSTAQGAVPLTITSGLSPG